MRKAALVIAGAVIAITAVACGAPARHAKPPATGQAAVPVVACPTTYGLPGTPPTSFPPTEQAPIAAALASRLAYYSDQGRSVRPILGPRGWSCVATVGADASVNIQVYPHGGSASGPEEVDASDDAACVGCIYGDACPLIPHAAAELHYPALPCPTARPPAETVTWVAGSPAFSTAGDDAVSFTDPPGVKGDGKPSGGPYRTTGMILFSWSPGTNSNLSAISCALPSQDSTQCAAIQEVFRQESWTAH